jgi:hypothetical protein
MYDLSGPVFNLNLPLLNGSTLMGNGSSYPYFPESLALGSNLVINNGTISVISGANVSVVAGSNMGTIGTSTVGATTTFTINGLPQGTGSGTSVTVAAGSNVTVGTSTVGSSTTFTVNSTTFGTGSVTNIVAGTGLTGGTITGTGTIAMGTSGVTPGTYGVTGTSFPIITTDALGRVTAVTLGTMSGGSGPTYIAGTGTAATGTGANNLSIGGTVGGTTASGAGTNQTLIGYNFTAGSASDIIAIVDNQSGTTVLKNALGTGSVTIGIAKSTTSGSQLGAIGSFGVAIGYDSQTGGAGGVAIGYNAYASDNGPPGVAIGSGALCTGGVAIGPGASAGFGNGRSIALCGSNYAANAINIGGSTSVGNALIQIGFNGTAANGGAVIIGHAGTGVNVGVTNLGIFVKDHNPYSYNLSVGTLANTGDIVNTKLIWFGTTAGTAATEIFLGGAASNRMTLGTNNFWAGIVTITARDETGTSAAMWSYQVGVRRESAANIIMVGTGGIAVPLGLGVQDAAFTTAPSITANTTNQALQISVTAPGTNVIRWSAMADGIWNSY